MSDKQLLSLSKSGVKFFFNSRYIRQNFSVTVLLKTNVLTWQKYSINLSMSEILRLDLTLPDVFLLNSDSSLKSSICSSRRWQEFHQQVHRKSCWLLLQVGTLSSHLINSSRDFYLSELKSQFFHYGFHSDQWSKLCQERFQKDNESSFASETK